MLILNRFLVYSHNALVAFGLCVYFRKFGQTNHLNCYFTETEIAGMVEASDTDVSDTLFSFLDEVVNKLCALNEIADITWMFTKFVDTVNPVC